MMFMSWCYQRFHVSTLLAWLSLGLLCGVVMGQFFHRIDWLPVVVLLSVFLAMAFRSKRWYACVVIVLCGMGFGVLRGGDFVDSLHQLDAYKGRSVTLNGVVSQDPVLTNGSNLWQLQLSTVQIEQQAFTGEVYATVVSDETLRRGDELTLSGKAQAGFGSFRLTFYRAQVRQVVRPDNPFLAARDTFAHGARQVLPEPEASLGLGFVVGQKAALSDDLTEQLKTVGLTHIIVASGYNLTILVRFARRRLSRYSRYLTVASALVLVAGFVLVSGFSPSMNRAAIVTVLSLLAWYYGRVFHPVKLILYVAAGSAAVYPTYAWSDLGWLLSFAAFSGVLVVAPIVTRLLYAKDHQPGSVTQLVIETLAAELMTLPIIVAAFGYIPVLALFANLLVAPVIPFAMLATFVAGLAGMISQLLMFVAIPASIVLAYVVAVVEALSSPEWARWLVHVPAWAIVSWYIALVLAGLVIWNRRQIDLLEKSVVE